MMMPPCRRREDSLEGEFGAFGSIADALPCCLLVASAFKQIQLPPQHHHHYNHNQKAAVCAFRRWFWRVRRLLLLVLLLFMLLLLRLLFLPLCVSFFVVIIISEGLRRLYYCRRTNDSVCFSVLSATKSPQVLLNRQYSRRLPRAT